MFQVTFSASSLAELKQTIAALNRELSPETPLVEAKLILDGKEEPPRRRFRVLSSPYPDINPGDVGEMVREMGPETIALRFEKLFSKADALEQRELAKRVIAFDYRQIDEVKP